MNKITSFSGFAIFLIIMWGCNSIDEPKQIETVKLKPFKSISAINDTTFFSMIVQISEYKDLLYLADFKNNRVLCVDTNLNYKYAIGRSGRGPGELIGATGVAVSGDMVYVADGGNKRINVYSLAGEFLASIKAGSSCRRFTTDTANSICLCTLNDTIPFVKLDIQGNFVSRFESRSHPCIFPLFNPFVKNSAHLLTDPFTNDLYCVYEFEPVIKKYSGNGRLVNRFDLSEVPFIKDRISKVKNIYKDIKRKNRGIIFFDGAYLYNSLIYVLYSSNTVLVFDTKNDKMKLVKVLELAEERKKTLGVFMSICVYNDNLISHNLSRGEIQVFKLK